MNFEYDYECQSCGHIMTVEQKPSDKKRYKKCPQCKKNELERVLFSAPQGFVEQEPTTIGQLSDRNRKKMGRYEIDKRDKESKKGIPEKKLGIWDQIGKLPKDKQKKLNDKDSIQKYIIEGK